MPGKIRQEREDQRGWRPPPLRLESIDENPDHEIQAFIYIQIHSELTPAFQR